MNCNHALDLMQRYLDGELQPHDQQMLLVHMRACDSCRLAHDQRQQLLNTAAAALQSQARAPADLAAAVSARIAGEPVPTRGLLSSIRRPTPRLRRAGLAIAAAAALALLAAALTTLRSLHSPASRPPSATQANQAHSGDLTRLANQPAIPSNEPEPKLAVGGQANRTEARIGDRRRSVALPQPASEKRPAQPLFAVIAAREPVADGAGKALQVGDRLSAGASVRTHAGGRVTLITRRGSEFTLDANSEIALASDGRSADLRAGRLYCRNRLGEFAAVTTPAGRIQLLGTTIDAAIRDKRTVAVTVVEGKIRLSNAHGEALVSAGKKAMLVAQLPPDAGTAVNVVAETAWYDGRRSVLSDFGDIAYSVGRGHLVTQVWVMKADGSDKRLLKSLLGWIGLSPGWLPGQQLLFAETMSLLWTQPDFAAHRAHTSAGHPIVEIRQWLLNAATGEDAVFKLPEGYRPLYSVISPDANWLAFNGSYQPSPENREKAEGGIWTYDLLTGEMRKVLNGWIKTWVAWSPDSRYLAATTGEGYGANYPLVIVNVQTGEVQSLNVQGAGPSFSPDGEKIAYCGEFQGAGSWYRGVLTTGSVQVLDLVPGSRPRRVSDNGAQEPRWSPDGTRIVYSVDQMKVIDADRGPVFPAYSVYVAQANGSAVKEIYRKEPTDEKGRLQAVAWAPSGDAVYLSTDQGILLVAADGSGVLQHLGGNETDSVMTPEQDAQMKAALTAIQEAVFQFAVGNVRAYEGKPRESKAAFTAAADLFASLPYEYPLAQFSLNDVLGYTDKAAELAARPADEILAKSCEERQSYLTTLLQQYAAGKGKFPQDLQAVESYSLENGWGINWISNHDTEWVKMMFRCPLGDLYPYSPPPDGEDPKVGDVLVICPNHPGNRVVWDERAAESLAWRRQR